MNEYGYHVARELQRDPLLSVTVLADELDECAPELDEFDVHRCWRYDSLSNPVRLLKAIHACKPDVVWFNLLFSTFGAHPVAAFGGLSTPLFTRLSGRYTHVTLHHLIENIDLSHAGVHFQRMYRFAGNVATRMLLFANSISVLLPAYRRTLVQKYRGENVHFRAHGILSARPEPPDYQKRGNPEHRILAFGKWGTYKRLELLIEAFEIAQRRMPNARLIIAGGNHPKTPGYVESIASRYPRNPHIRFTGYVPENEIPDLYSTASVMVMPYASATGSSGVAHLAAEYGMPIICSDIADFHEMADDEGLAILFYQTDSAHHLAEQITGLLSSPELMRRMSERNFSAALRQTMPQIVRQYLRSFDLHRRTRALQPISRFRRIPGWVPSRSAIYRAAAPRWASWI